MKCGLHTLQIPACVPIKTIKLVFEATSGSSIVASMPVLQALRALLTELRQGQRAKRSEDHLKVL
eukprot:2559626-Amphidinium_carterae.1